MSDQPDQECVVPVFVETRVGRGLVDGGPCSSLIGHVLSRVECAYSVFDPFYWPQSSQRRGTDIGVVVLGL